MGLNVVPKIANPRNHQGADTDASTWGFISKLELGPKCTQHRGAGTWTPKWVTAGFFIGWSRGFFRRGGGISQVLFTFWYGAFRALSSVLILIWDFLPLAWALFSFWYGIPCRGHSAVFPVKFSSYSQGPKMAVLVLMLNLRWNGLNFSRPPHSGRRMSLGIIFQQSLL